MLRWIERILILPLLALAAYGGFRLLGYCEGPERAGEQERIESYLKEQATDSVVADIRFDERLPSLYVLPIRNDFKGDVRTRIQQKIQALGFIRLEEDASKVARRIRELSGGGESEFEIVKRFRAFLEPDEKAAFTETEALDFGRRYGIDALLLARVVEVGPWDESPRLILESKVLNTKSGETVLPWKKHRAELTRSPLSLPYASIKILGVSPWLRVLGWLGLALLLPLALASVTRRVLARESNRANAALLGAFTAVDIVAIWLLLGFSLSGFLPFLAVIVGGSIALAYNFVLLTRLEALRR